MAGRAAAHVSAVGDRTGPMVAVRLGRRFRIDGRKTQLFCAWLAWARFRVVIPV